MISGLLVIGQGDSQRRVELTKQHTAAGCRHSHHARASQGTCCHDEHWGANGAECSICVTLNLQINGKENVRGQPSEAQGEVRELHQTGELLDLYHLLHMRKVGENFALLSIVNLSIDPLLTVQQETE